MAVNINGEKPLQNMMMNNSNHKGSFLNLFHQSVLNLDYYSYSYFSSTRLGNVRNTAEVTESLPLLLHCRDPMESLASPRNIKILKIGEGHTLLLLGDRAYILGKARYKVNQH